MDRRIALVGNAPVNDGAAVAIDSHDMVVRFNRCAHYGPAGRRTDVLVLVNTGQAGRGFGKGRRPTIDPDALASARALWLARNPLVNVAEACRHKMLAGRKTWHFQDDDWKDHTLKIVRRHARGRPWRCLGVRIYLEAMRAMIERGASELQTPSTGMLALFHIRRHVWPARVTLFGFTHQGWKGHPFEAERAQIAEWRDWVSYA